jgi:hypothetical protein
LAFVPGDKRYGGPQGGCRGGDEGSFGQPLAQKFLQLQAISAIQRNSTAHKSFILLGFHWSISS